MVIVLAEAEAVARVGPGLGMPPGGGGDVKKWRKKVYFISSDDKLYNVYLLSVVLFWIFLSIFFRPETKINSQLLKVRTPKATAADLDPSTGWSITQPAR